MHLDSFFRALYRVCPVALISSNDLGRYLFATQVLFEKFLSRLVALKTLRNPPVPKGSCSMLKSTVFGVLDHVIPCKSKVYISTDVELWLITLPSLSISTRERLFGTNLLGATACWPVTVFSRVEGMLFLLSLASGSNLSSAWSFYKSHVDG